MRVLLLSTTTGYQLRSFDDAAARLGVELLFATDRCHVLEDPWQDRAIAVRFDDEASAVDAVRTVARERSIDGVLPVGDRPVVLAAAIAKALGLPGNSPDAARTSANKQLARDRFAAAGMMTPDYFVVDAATSANDAARRADYPVVVKPLGLSGSRGVIRANSPRELVAAIERVRALLARPDVRALRLDTGGAILVERYVDGREYAVEGLLTRGAFRSLAIFDKPDPLEGPFFEETIYVTPPVLPQEDTDAITREIARAVRALGLEEGPVHAECRISASGVFVLEVAARPIGGLCSRVLRFGPSGEMPLEELLLRHACGEPTVGIERELSASAVMMIPIQRRGILRRVEGVEAARHVARIENVEITAKADQLLEPLPEAGSYLGFIFARAPRAADAEQAVREAHRRLAFVLDPAIVVTGV
jgi:biotin carboxylase